MLKSIGKTLAFDFILCYNFQMTVIRGFKDKKLE